MSKLLSFGPSFFWILFGLAIGLLVFKMQVMIGHFSMMIKATYELIKVVLDNNDALKDSIKSNDDSIRSNDNTIIEIQKDTIAVLKESVALYGRMWETQMQKPIPSNDFNGRQIYTVSIIDYLNYHASSEYTVQDFLRVMDTGYLKKEDGKAFATKTDEDGNLDYMSYYAIWAASSIPDDATHIMWFPSINENENKNINTRILDPITYSLDAFKDLLITNLLDLNSGCGDYLDDTGEVLGPVRSSNENMVGAVSVVWYPN